MVYLVLDVRRSLRYYLEHGVPIFYDYDIFNIKEIFVLTCKLVTHSYYLNTTAKRVYYDKNVNQKVMMLLPR